MPEQQARTQAITHLAELGVAGVRGLASRGGDKVVLENVQLDVVEGGELGAVDGYAPKQLADFPHAVCGERCFVEMRS